MRRQLLLRATVIGAIAITACTGTAITTLGAPDADAILPSVLHAVPAVPPYRPDSATVTVVQGHVVVDGLLNQDLGCFRASVTATRSIAHLVVWVSATQVPGCRSIVRGAFVYDVTLGDIPSGEYHVQVVHNTSYDQGGIEQVRMRAAPVRVP